jgi:SAM-dependent methyltransferase
VNAQVIPTEPELAHLGGYVPGGDDATWYPDLWRYLVKKLDIKSVLDIGCGDGQALKFFRDELGCRATGLDGLPQEDPHIHVHDFTKGNIRHMKLLYHDLVWCCEFVEHIPEEHVAKFLTAFQFGGYVAMTHAEPGQPGHHHVNCKSSQYWIGALAAAGFEFDDILTKCARIAASANPSPWNHFKRSGLVFKRY